MTEKLVIEAGKDYIASNSGDIISIIYTNAGGTYPIIGVEKNDTDSAAKKLYYFRSDGFPMNSYLGYLKEYDTRSMLRVDDQLVVSDIGPIACESANTFRRYFSHISDELNERGEEFTGVFVFPSGSTSWSNEGYKPIYVRYWKLASDLEKGK